MSNSKKQTKAGIGSLAFEHKNKPLLPAREFYKRQLLFIIYASMLITVSLSIGIFGYHAVAGLDWTESFHNSAMILAGMGEIDTMPDNTSKIFSGCYALFSGVVFLSTVAVMFSPLVHRLLHMMHMEGDDQK
ncbi:MAG TPA: hypothetical protein VMZ69_06565 [Saprospiraceae bacterium]|nr:hypothetical protein [Saprospiraceae bacterium]